MFNSSNLSGNYQQLLRSSTSCGSNLQRHHITNTIRCPIVTKRKQQLICFLYCIYAQRWASGFPNTLLQQPQTDLESKLEIIFQQSSTMLNHLQHLPWWILWRIWKTRNKLMFQQKLYSLEDNTQCSLFCILFWCKGIWIHATNYIKRDKRAAFQMTGATKQMDPTNDRICEM